MSTNLRFALSLSYKGSAYAGIQKLHAKTQGVANVVEDALSKIANHKIHIYPAGRTDKGVHAIQQVAHFDTHAVRSEHAWKQGTNRWLPKDIRVHWVKSVSPNFHARFSAKWRRYCYVLHTSPIIDACMQEYCWHYQKRLNVEKMREACKKIHGEFDCSAFSVQSCTSTTPFRCIDWIRVHASNNWLVIDVQANAFLKRMVRIIVNELLAIGSSDISPKTLIEQFTKGIATTPKKAVPPHGLYLIHIGYATDFALPMQHADDLWCMQLAKH